MAAGALGVAGLCYLDALTQAVSARHTIQYHMVGSVWSQFLPLIVNVLVLAALLYLLLWALRGSPRLERLACAALVSFVPWLLMKNLFVPGWEFSHHDSVRLVLACAACTLLLGAAPGRWMERLFGLVWRSGRAVLAIGGLVVAVTLVQVALLGFAARHLNSASQPGETMRAGVNAPTGRVIWIVLDELGYEQVYGNRVPGLALPNFDQLASQATVFSDVRPAGLYTEIVLPSLMTGEHLNAIRANSAGWLLMDTGHGTQPFNAQNTVFADADALGYRSAVVGWFNPYCRLLAPVLADCYWTSSDGLSEIFPAHTVGANMVYPLVRAVRKVPQFLEGSGGAPVEINGKIDGERFPHILQFVNLDREGTRALKDPRDTFLFLHMPVPHPMGIWDRETHRFAANRSTYVDNLALADDYLGQVRSLLQAAGEWDDATVIVMGDHAFRTMLWSRTTWTAEDAEAAHGGIFDDRPGYIVKLPGQHEAAQISQPFAAEDTRLLLDQLLAHAIQTPAQLQAWVATAPKPRDTGGVIAKPMSRGED